MKKYQNMQSINSIMGKVAKNLGIERGLRQVTLLNFWHQIVGRKFEKNSKAVSVAYKNGRSVLIVGVSSSAVAQELQMFRADILKKIIPIAASLEIKIDDIYFSTKYWENESSDSSQEPLEHTEIFKRKPTKEELEQIELPESIVKTVTESINKSKNTEDLKERMIKTALDDVKTHIWKRNNGFPFCENCGVPLRYKKVEGKNLCPSCEYSGF